MVSVIVEERPYTVEVDETVVRADAEDVPFQIVVGSEQGPPGPPGPPVAAVVYDAVQSLSAPQKEKARDNIGAVGATDLETKANKAGDTFTGPVLVPSGAQTAPGLGLVGDPDTGFYSDGAGILWMVSDGARSIRFSGSAVWLAGNGHEIRFGAGADARILRSGTNLLAVVDGTGSGPGRLNLGSATAANAGLRADGAGGIEVRAGDNSGAGNLSARVITASSGVRKVPVTVGVLPTPTTGIAGLEMIVSDALTNTRGDVVAAGGSNLAGVRCDGSNWRIT